MRVRILVGVALALSAAGFVAACSVLAPLPQVTQIDGRLGGAIGEVAVVVAQIQALLGDGAAAAPTADLDSSTRSRSVVLTLPAAAATDPGPVLGDTVALILEQTVAAPGFWAPLGVLREGVRGSWSVMALETTAEGNRTLPAAVEVIHTEGTRVFLRGHLPPGARVVAEAPARVAPGQFVLAQFAAARE